MKSLFIIRPPRVKSKTPPPPIDVTFLQFASPPLSGSFVIESILPNGEINKTAEMQVSATIGTIKTNIENTFPRYKDRIAVWDNPAYTSYGG